MPPVIVPMLRLSAPISGCDAATRLRLQSSRRTIARAAAATAFRPSSGVLPCPAAPRTA